MLSSERSHPPAGFLDERPRPNDAHPFAGTKVSDVVRDEEAGPRADRCGQDWHVLRVSELARAFTVARGRMMNLNRNRAEELLKQRDGLGKLRERFRRTSTTASSGNTRTEESDLAEDQDCVAGTRA